MTCNSGVVYSDYFQIHIHYRFTAERPVSTSKAQLPAARLIVVADIEFVKPCLFKARKTSKYTT